MAVAQVPGGRFGSESFSRLGRFLSFFALTSVLTMVPLAHAQSTPTGNSTRRVRPTTPAVGPSIPTPQDVAPVAPIPLSNAPVALAAQQLAPQPPVVNWDGNLLTIDAENSTLTDILTAVRSRTGASMEIPPSASGERVFVHLGPGPIREIVSSLLYGTGFDYIVETAEDDPNALRKLVVTVRGSGEDSAGGSLAIAAGVDGDSSGNKAFSSIAQSVPSHDGMRMMRGWSAPGKPAFQADAEAAIAAQEAAAESGSTSDSGEAKGQTSPTTGTEQASGAEEATNSTTPPQSSPPSAQNGTSVSETDLPPASAQEASSSSVEDSSDQPGVSKMIQNMTNMFQQRRQIQAQQNQTVQQQKPAE